MFENRLKNIVLDLELGQYSHSSEVLRTLIEHARRVEHLRTYRTLCLRLRMFEDEQKHFALQNLELLRSVLKRTASSTRMSKLEPRSAKSFSSSEHSNVFKRGSRTVRQEDRNRKAIATLERFEARAYRAPSNLNIGAFLEPSAVELVYQASRG